MVGEEHIPKRLLQEMYSGSSKHPNDKHEKNTFSLGNVINVNVHIIM